MCIAIISTAHPAYRLIIINNRDEYFHRPTSALHWWRDPNSHVLASRDLARPEQGTWIGITKQGRIAILTNYREDKSHAALGRCSRGGVVNAFLTLPPEATKSLAPHHPASKLTASKSTLNFCADMIRSETARNAGGFSLICGYFDEPLSVISNRMSKVDNILSIAERKGETIGISNTVFTDRSWPKILDGERLVEATIADHVQAGKTENEEDLIRRLLDILNRDTFPRDAASPLATVDDLVHLFRRSIFVPVIGGRCGSAHGHEHHKSQPETGSSTSKSTYNFAHNFPEPISPCATASSDGAYPESTSKMPLEYHLSGPYGTQRQTILLVTESGRVRYFERALYDSNATPIPIGKGDRNVEFMIE